ncbi:MAG: glutamine synthetase beta-grasp domain-containing protein [Oscillospiraceae bacterium]|nr:glutamine synthetase beta-grasp domain-containing protein [Oscillospiraceae bacterium]
MNYSEKEVLSFVEENDVKFIRLTFTDLSGCLKNLAIMPSELQTALKTGIKLDASVFYGKNDCSHNDIFLVPDTSTLSVLPWRPKTGRVVRFFCDIKNLDGTQFECDMRACLKNTINKMRDKGFSCNIGTECQFYLFETDDNGDPTHKTNDKAGYLDVAPRDHGENIRREICLSIHEMGIFPETSRHLYGHGQNEITFRYGDVLSACDNLINFKTAVKSIASQNGLYASFMPYPIIDQPRSALLINFSITHNGKNIFSQTDNNIKAEGAQFIAGILRRINEITAFLNPLTNSYHRNGIIPEPMYVNWAKKSRDHLIRIPSSHPGLERIELRSADPSCNMYVVLNLLITAGMEGIEEKLSLDSYSDSSKCMKLPQSLKQAAELTSQSDFVRKVFSEFAVDSMLSLMSADAQEYENSDNKEAYEADKYFNFI